MLEESRFVRLASGFIDRAAEAIEDAAADRAEVDLQGGILTVAIEGVGQYVLNRHGPMRQLWLSSPRSGASHYDYDQASGRWRDSRGGPDLASRWREELAAAGIAVALD
ncbi:MAG: iron donor protein CyaY [Alphaproteobacteria bacterium]|nr:iron donor protein CyaY [Alphaproteobacteria bacterium]